MSIKQMVLLIIIILLLLACSHQESLDTFLERNGYIKTDLTEKDLLSMDSNFHECIEYNDSFYCI